MSAFLQGAINWHELNRPLGTYERVKVQMYLECCENGTLTIMLKQLAAHLPPGTHGSDLITLVQLERGRRGQRLV